MNKILIANRGEIALRVLRTAGRLGWATVAIHTDLDAGAPHVCAAGEAHRVESYLDIDAVVAAALGSGAQFVHPGYGFLSERAEFARAVAEAGLTLVGPSAEVMEDMGKKDAAREIAIAAGVPVVPAYALDADPDDLAYPVLVKAAAGGGGKGMRIVRTKQEYAEGRAAAAREAAKAFGDDTLLVEKYVERGRHIEVQVFGDSHGNVVHLFERDCSTQRRHQKVLEEAPAPTISAAQRELVTGSALALARHVGYTNAGTVEFLLDVDSGEVYFLEMNTRLQVEHPVTEEIIRIRGERVDLVEIQLRVATGEALGFTQEDVAVDGHAIEARIYAEDSFGGFLPQAGTVTKVDWPHQCENDTLRVRVDHALFDGQEVSTSYDPMLGKVITWGRTREEARATMIQALDLTRIRGLTTNTGFVRTLLAGDEFRDADIDTAWLDRHQLPAPSTETPRALAALALAPSTGEDRSVDPWCADGFRLGGESAPTLVEVDQLVAVRPGHVGDQAVVLRSSMPSNGGRVVHAEVDGEEHAAIVKQTGPTIEVIHRGQRHLFERPDPFADHGPVAGDGTILAPMPGTVLVVNVEAGQHVVEGETLGAMEAMKMELALKAPFAGTMTEVAARVGQQVKLGAVLFVVEAEIDA